MRFNAAQLLKANSGETRLVEVDDRVPFDEEGVVVIEPVRGLLRLTRDHAGILVQGDLFTRVRTTCARCLAPAEVDISFTVEEEFHPSVFIPGGPPVPPVDEQDPATQIDEHHVLDIAEVVRQDVAVAIPWNAVCREDCRGLCARCGVDLNSEQCSCADEPDPRWAALEALKDIAH
jgi:uncharacterized protein